MAAEIKDGDAAASYQVVDTYQFPGFKIIQFDLAVLSHYRPGHWVADRRHQLIAHEPGESLAALSRPLEADIRYFGPFGPFGPSPTGSGMQPPQMSQ